MIKFKHKKLIVLGCAVFYLLCVFYITLFSRIATIDSHYNLNLFWSYKAIFNGRPELAWEILLNVILFMPLGYMLSLLLDKVSPLVNAMLTVIIAFALSGLIELYQYSFNLGLYEYDDMLNNAFGALLGANCCFMVKKYMPKVTMWLVFAGCVAGIIGTFM